MSQCSLSLSGISTGTEHVTVLSLSLSLGYQLIQNMSQYSLSLSGISTDTEHVTVLSPPLWDQLIQTFRPVLLSLSSPLSLSGYQTDRDISHQASRLSLSLWISTDTDNVIQKVLLSLSGISTDTEHVTVLSLSLWDINWYRTCHSALSLSLCVWDIN